MTNQTDLIETVLQVVTDPTLTEDPDDPTRRPVNVTEDEFLNKKFRR